MNALKKMEKTMKKYMGFWAAALVGLLIPVSLAAQEQLDLTVQPETITIGASFTGTTLAVSGLIPEDCEAVAVMSGERKELHLKEKGKALGLLWMNMGSLKYTGVPDVFFVASPRAIGDMKGTGPEDELSVSRVGFSGLKNTITVESEKPGTLKYVDELFKLKSKDGLYQEQTGNVTYTEAGNGSKAFHVNIALPSRLSPEKYTVHVYAVKDGRIVSDGEKPVEAKLTGIPLFLANMAFGNSLLFGILATLIAIFGGLVIGIVFQGAKEGSH